MSVLAVIAATLVAWSLSASAATTNGEPITWAQVQCFAVAGGVPLAQNIDIGVQDVVPNNVATGAAYTSTVPGGTATLPSQASGQTLTGFKNIGQTYLYRSNAGSPQITSATANGTATNNGNPVAFNVSFTNEGTTVANGADTWTNVNGGTIQYQSAPTTGTTPYGIVNNQVVDITGATNPDYNFSGVVAKTTTGANFITVNGRSLNITAESWSAAGNGTFTYTTNVPHKMVVGQHVSTISNTPGMYNRGTNTSPATVAAVLSDTQFTIANTNVTTDPGPATALGKVDTLGAPGPVGANKGSLNFLTTVTLNTPAASPGTLTTPDVTVGLTAPGVNSTVTTYGAAVTTTATTQALGDAPTLCQLPHFVPQTDGISATFVGTGNASTSSNPTCRPAASCPQLTGLTPTSGSTAGGTSVAITGSGFTGATGVSFGTTAAASFTVNSDTSVTAVSPAEPAGTVDVRVLNVNGTPSGTSTASKFTFVAPAPTVTSVSPTSGSTTGGTSVTITGTNFTGATAVNFGAAAGTSVNVVDDSHITVTSPAHAAGTVDVTVTTPSGTSATSANDQFTFTTNAPSVASVSPTSGPAAGGTSVTITGSNFTGATAVSFGGTAAASFTVNNATSITAVSPLHAAGTVDVTVTTAGGTSATSANDQFTFVAAPAVTSVSPNSGPTSGGTSVTITGTDFTGATAVSFGGTAAASFTVNNATSITAASPAHAAGTVDVTVTSPNGTSATSANDQFTFVAAPTVTSVSPTSGPPAGGTSVTITGTGFTGASAVSFGGTAAASFTVNNATSITAVSPAHAAGTVDVTVTTPAGTSATSASDHFTFVSGPTVTSVSPAAGTAAGGTSVTITGTGFTGASAVSFGGTAAASFTVNNATSITAVSPPHAAGTVDVTVTTPGGTSATSANDQFTFVAAPVVTSVSPTSGPTAGGTSVTIGGSGFTAASAVSFGGTAAASFVVNNDGSITAVSPAEAAGTVDVTVTTTAGTSATSANDQFTFVAASGCSSGCVSIGDKAQLEGDTLNRGMAFKVTLSQPATTTVTVDYTVMGGTAVGGTKPGTGADFKLKTGTLTFTPNVNTGLTAISKQIGVLIFGDTTTESDKTFSVVLSNVTGGYSIGRGIGTGTILNDDGGPTGITLGVGDGSIVVQHSGHQTLTLPVTLSAKSLNTTTVNFTITPGSATYSQKVTDGGDFGGAKTSGTLTFNPGATTKMIASPVWPDLGSDTDETYTVTLSGPTGGVTLIRDTGTGTLIGPS